MHNDVDEDERDVLCPMMMTSNTTKSSLTVASSKKYVPEHLNAAIVSICAEATKSRGVFTIALSGGSLPSFLSSVEDSFKSAGIDPRFNCWHVLLADERCVPSTDPDSNLGALKEKFLAHVSIPSNQVYGINEEKLKESTEAVATAYEVVLRKVLKLSGDQLDLAVLGFGPDGHTCSLFPGHELLQEKTKWVAAIEDSPKPPPKRITLTLPVLNFNTSNVIFCGAGESKSPILQKVFDTVSTRDTDYTIPHGKRYEVTFSSPPPYPCAMVQPDSPDTKNTLCWVVDADAMSGICVPE